MSWTAAGDFVHRNLSFSAPGTGRIAAKEKRGKEVHGMSKEVKAIGRRRAQVDIKRLVTGLLLLVQQDEEAESSEAPASQGEEPAA
jgi:hypothetical protein